MKENTERYRILEESTIRTTFVWFSIRLQSIHLCLIEPRGAFRRLLACKNNCFSAARDLRMLNKQWKSMKIGEI